jgi:APA family basic amino acid/polyamine antiporter
MAQQQLKRILGKGFSIAACMGTIIGLGILRTPGEIATTIHDPVIYMALWIGGGVMVLLSLAVAAELLATTPRSGGMYALIAHAYGPYPGFLIGWTDWVANGASGALKSVVLMEYLALINPDFRPFITPGAMFISTCFAALQLGGVRTGGNVYQAAAAGIGVIMLVIVAAIFYGGPATGSGAAIAGPATETVGIAAYGMVAASIAFTYDGWMGASYFGGEIKGGGRMTALGSIRGLLIVIFLYIVLNLALVMNIPLSSLSGHDLALAGALEILFGPVAGMMIVWFAVFILLAHHNVQYMLGTRILYALSVDDLGTDRATTVSEKGTPTGSLLFNWILMIALILIGGFEFLLSMAALLFIVMYVAVMLGVFRLRRQEPDIERPYMAWGFPVSGVICAVFWTAVALFVALTDLRSSAYSLGLVAISIPAFLWLKSRRHLGESVAKED